MRLRVFERDGWKCRICGDTAKTLHAHHPAYHPYAEGPWDYHDDAIVTLCSECHSGEHEQLRAAQANLLIALAKKGQWGSYELDCLTEAIEAGRVDL